MTRKNIFITSFFRTKHHHLRRSLCGPLGYHPATTVGLDQQGDEEHVINVHAAQVLFRLDSQVFDQHTKATTNNVQLLNAYSDRVKVVVMMRNIVDTLAACKRYLDDEEGCFPGVQSPRSWYAISDAAKWRWVCHNIAPWLLSFYYSWTREDLTLRRLFIWHEDYVRDPVGSLGSVLYSADYPSPPYKVLQESIDHEYGPDVGQRQYQIHVDARDILEAQIDAWGPEWSVRMRKDLFR